MSAHEGLVVRAVAAGDLAELLVLSELAGAGMTSMPVEESVWVSRIEASAASFARAPGSDAPEAGDVFFLVLEDLAAGKLAGCCGLHTHVGIGRPFYNYKLSTITSSSATLGRTVHTPILSLVNDYVGSTELGTLFLHPDYRRDGIGRFLSRSRFMFVADFPERVNEQLIAELRGWLDEQGNSPFWEELGQKFFDISYAEADRMSGVEGYQFISDLMPRHPVYVDLLPQRAQEVIGKLHENTSGAMHILKDEGFEYTGYVDIFDAGPCVQVNRERIRTVKASRTCEVAAPTDETNDMSERALVSNCDAHDYRMVSAEVGVDLNAVALPEPTREALGVNIGDSVRVVS